MNLETYLAFVMFVIVMTGTPGPGNMTMMAIGQTAGFRSAVPFLAGTVVGMIILNTLVGFGLGAVLLASPNVAWGMKIGGMGYICYLAWKIMMMQFVERKADHRFTFFEGCILHPTNPKSWAMSVVGLSQIASPDLTLFQQMALFIPTFTLFQFSFHSLWGFAGTAILKTLKSKSTLTAVNALLVTLMISATAYALFMG